VRIVYTGPFKWSIENRNALSSMADVLRIRLREAIREDKGGTYGISVGPAMIHFPTEEYRITISFGCAPERVDELLKEVAVQVDSLQRFGTDQSYITKVKEQSRRERETSVKQNRWWLNRLQAYYWNNDDIREYFRFETLIESITPASVKAAAVQYLNPGSTVRVVLYPNK
jgi:zinc protease